MKFTNILLISATLASSSAFAVIDLQKKNDKLEPNIDLSNISAANLTPLNKSLSIYTKVTNLESVPVSVADPSKTVHTKNGVAFIKSSAPRTSAGLFSGDVVKDIEGNLLSVSGNIELVYSGELTKLAQQFNLTVVKAYLDNVALVRPTSETNLEALSAELQKSALVRSATPELRGQRNYAH